MSGQLLNTIALTELAGVGAKMAEKLHKIGLNNVQDVLFHLPLRYEDRTRIWPINRVAPGQFLTVQGEVSHCSIQFGKRKMLTVKIGDTTGSVTLKFFNFNAAMKNSFSQGKQVKAYGEIKGSQFGLEIIHPDYRLFSEPTELSVEETLTPVYPTTDGLRQTTLRNLTDQALALLEKSAVTELLPAGLYDQQMTLAQALQLMHRPTADISLEQLDAGKHPAQKRLILEELLAQNLSMLALRSKGQQHQSWSFAPQDTLKQQLLASLPFTPTGAQQRVVADIEADLAKSQPMMRLVQGDVGSGKTLVAALAALRAIEHGYQVALMAPTELLAEQHVANFSQWLNPMGIGVGWMAGKLKGKAREKELVRIANGDAKMVVGTHALFQDQVVFNNLALIIIDEQHRFGVHQRLDLREKGATNGCYPHQLVMTATPIPRTLAMTAYADMDTSVIDELPPGRTPIQTVALPDSRRPQIIERIRAACQQEGRQTYWVCTLIDESEVLEAQAASDTADELTRLLPELKVGLVHGRMKPKEKQAIMASFKAGEIDLLVATTVIEVGVDVPNASLMVIENPERLGLAQLHQLRGRVGRGEIASHCVLLYHAPLTKTAQKRLAVLRESSDGFVIAERDLEIRGPGELLGTKQTGIADFKVADLIRDQYLIPQVQKLARHIHDQYPDNAIAIIDRWIGQRENYSNA
ncbi:ATP-dependent DNA helicase RecG [Photobacterium iliopiscarium]|jgi:ATP-dependent DNA helicase RecG|uniref:ATP-dependent DNA helicase RecG n=1 Tax=Photobacterium iliopiscarium TaxID=56192 RepID=UPI0005D4231C|nr:ATP-dependent DNA helicase RecG [Photobacterium iliopiscarium]KJG14026.1 ATP-dependent DNA helicase RecG [Photobacterium iliopiscarium]MCD9485733.1 ATP-dependent DNA helicase RecG [Photobacterium iliopiscarium]MCF2242430.1 ATP-dependent DNA helicase RecG [Photobacterium iliopiscarium]PST99075.1 DNA helicase RecG [Photobacterium iliopiscarium]PSV81803.1 DNA helicase RecG [Photobacterium iliopiscarium]